MSTSEPVTTAHARTMSRTAAGGCLVFGALLTGLTMAANRRLNFGVEVGLIGLLLCSLGVLRFVRGFAPVSPSPADAPKLFGTPLAIWLASVGAFYLVAWSAVQGLFPAHEFVSGVLVTSCFIGCVVTTFQLGSSLGFFEKDEHGQERSLAHRHGFWLLVLAALLYLPMLGNFGLIDPWETHYGEAAREMLARDDWISLWWAQDGWFWSKPILNFWMQGLSFKLLGVDYMPDQMLSGALSGHWPQPEWAARLPLFGVTATAVYVLYRSCIRPFGRRTAFLVGLVLLTCPYWFLLARQTMADMPYVAPVTAACAFLLIGFQTAPDATVKEFVVRVGKRQFVLSAYHLLFTVVLLCVLPQVLYLASRNLTLHLGDPSFGFRPHLDEIMRGSGGGNCGQPGNRACSMVKPSLAWGIRWGQPAYGALLWLSCLGGWLFINRRERRAQRLMFLSAWFCTALAFMGKGAPGLVIPLATALAYVGVTGRFRELLRLEWLSFLLLLLAVGLPWYVQMYMRHGFPFIERLVLHDMVKRAFDHVHDTNKGDDTSFRYYLWQLGYGLFPWTGLAAGGMLWVSRRDQRANDKRSDAALFIMIWWLVSFGMFSITRTKFHHYILPILPPTAVFTAVLLSRYVPAKLPATWPRTAAYFSGQLGAASLLFFGTLMCIRGNVIGSVYNGELGPARLGLGLPMVLSGGIMAVFAARLFGPPKAEVAVEERTENAKSRAVFRSATLGVIALSAAIPIGLAGRDMFVNKSGDVDGQLRLLHLFTYNYDRVWPASIDFRPALVSFTLVCTLACTLLAFQSIRRHAGVLMCATAVCWCAWVTDVYLVHISPHWGQRETMLSYVKARGSVDEPLVAYQMNWKGENFYTGNKMATFVSTGKKFKRWIKKQRKKGVRTMFFTTEHSRVSGLKRELGKPKDFQLLTNKKLNNKFTLAKVVFEPLKEKEKTEKDAKKKQKRKNDKSKVLSGAPSSKSSAPILKAPSLRQESMDRWKQRAKPTPADEPQP